jgi:predicted short-subunit dehydrogenase-like oxidoreductase (DUF2520 family)
MSAAPDTPGVLVVGPGAAGAALAAALAGAGWGPRVWGRDEARTRAVAERLGLPAPAALRASLEKSDVVLVAVRDEALGCAGALLDRAWPADGRLRSVLHLAGAWPSRALGALAARKDARCGVLHPVVALRGIESAGAFRGAWATVSGAERARADAKRIAEALGLRAGEVDDDARALLHAGAVSAAGHVVTLLAAAEELVAAGGVAAPESRSIVASLAESALALYREGGAARALTGPLARGDVATVEAHLAGLRGAGARHASAAALYGALARACIEQLEKEGRLAPKRAADLRALLDGGA